MALVDAWIREGATFERYAYAPGPAGGGELHAHGDLQFCLSLNFPGRYRTARGSFDVPAGAVSTILPGEAHASGDLAERTYRTRFLMLYLSPERAAAIHGGTAPVLRDGISLDPDLAHAFLDAHGAGSRLDAGDALARFLDLASERMRGERPPAPAPHDSGGLERARTLLHDDPGRDLTLDDLAHEVGLDPAYLCRAFARRYGLPPGAYRRALRLDAARNALLRGRPVGEVAATHGFSDGSHFTRHFQKAFGVSPRAYAKGQ